MPADHPNAETSSKPPVATFRPRPHPLLPVEVISRSEIRRRRRNANLGGRHTHDFHQLVVCDSGEGVHHVDHEPIPMHPGRVLHIHPGQIHEYQFEPNFDASVVVCRSGVFRTATPSGQWFPGTGPSMLSDFTDHAFGEIISTVDDIRTEQERFDGSVLSVMLIRTCSPPFWFASFDSRPNTPPASSPKPSCSSPSSSRTTSEPDRQSPGSPKSSATAPAPSTARARPP